MDIRPIRSDKDHVVALAEIERLWNAPKGSPESDRLDMLTLLAEAYQKRRWSIEAPEYSTRCAMGASV